MKKNDRQSASEKRRVTKAVKPAILKKRSGTSGRPFPIVGIGASAGGLEAYKELLQHLPGDTGMAFVIVQHLAPDYSSDLAQILARSSAMGAQEATNKLKVKPNHIYVIPSNKDLEIANGKLKLIPRALNRGTPRSIDRFFESLAHDQKEWAIGIILSGTATDGTLGAEAIKAEGGITFAQNETAKYDSMPRSAVVAGCIDLVMSPQGMAKKLAEIARHPYIAGHELMNTKAAHAAAAGEENQKMGSRSGGRRVSRTGANQARSGAEPAPIGSEVDGFKQIVLLLRNHSGVDFSLYKSTTIQRRITRRMVLNRLASLEEYARHLKSNASELDSLYSDVLISVTSFFRNPEVFEFLKKKVFPKMAPRRREDPLRIWVLGCSTGQEAYSMAMALEEFFDELPRKPKIQIFATDLNEALLDKARAGRYAKSLVQDISSQRLRRFFVEEEGGYRISKALREMIIFARQNILNDPPFSRMDMITCRNVLIYIEGSFQKKIIPTFHYALKPGGILFLGASESISSYTDLFDSVDKKHRVYLKKPAPTPVLNLQFAPHHPGEKKGIPRVAPKISEASAHPEINVQREAERVALNRFVPPSVLINTQMLVLHFRGDTSSYLKPPSGKASFNLLQMAREGLMMPLRAAINKARRDNITVRKDGLWVKQKETMLQAGIEVIPLKNLNGRYFLVFFLSAKAASTGAMQAVQNEAGESKSSDGRESGGALRHQINALEQDLAENQDYLQSIQEQYEGTNEELQASNEEVTSANEELQSTNEELETSKEELESTNEELTTLNEELATRNRELAGLNGDLCNLYLNVNMPIMVLARDLTIRRFTTPAEKLFHLKASDLGRSINSLNLNLDFRGLEELITEVIDTVSLRERETVASDQRWYSLRIRPYLTNDNKVDGAVLVFVDIDEVKRSEREARIAHENAEITLRTAPVPLLVLGGDLKVELANESFYRMFRTSPDQTVGKLIYELGNGQWNIPKLRQFLEEIIPRNTFFENFEVIHEFSDVGRKAVFLNSRRLDKQEGVPHRILLSIEDFTARFQAEANLRTSEMRFRRLFEAARDGILVLDPASRKITDANSFMMELVECGREKILGRELWQIGLLKDQPSSHRFFRHLQQRGYVRFDDVLFVSKSKRKINLEWIANRYLENGREVIQCNIRDITERKTSENELKQAKAELERANQTLECRVQERTATLQELNTRLQDLSARVVTAQERERTRIARELHDDIGQTLTGLKLYMERQKDSAKATINEMQPIISEVIQRVRQLSLELHPQVLDDLGLKVALEWLFKTYHNRTSVRVQFDWSDIPDAVLNPQTQIAIYRVVQEGLTNVAKHAQVSAALVRIHSDADAIYLEIHDSGRGFEITEKSFLDSFGVTGMRERITLLGGTFRFDSAPGKGTHLFVRLPLHL